MNKKLIVKVLFGLLDYIISGKRYHEVNPYFLPEVKDGLKLLAELDDSTDWLNAMDNHRKKEQS